jgi:CHAT domain-containing protein
MTRAFLYAGSRAISLTLWDNGPARAITPPFFAAMSDGASPADALRLAKLRMLRSNDPELRQPWAWAATVMYGDGEMLR